VIGASLGYIRCYSDMDTENLGDSTLGENAKARWSLCWAASALAELKQDNDVYA